MTEFTLCYVKSQYAFDQVGVLGTERMSNILKDKSGDTVRILRPPPRVFTDLCGRNVWMGDVESLELALEQPENTDPYNSAEVAERIPQSIW